MFNKKYFTFFLAAVFFLVGGAAVFAQTAPMSGKVELRKADGTTEPVASMRWPDWTVASGPDQVSTRRSRSQPATPVSVR